MGPASIGVLMVYGGEIKTGLGFFLAYLSISAAVICVGALLLVSNYIQKAIGKERVSGAEQTHWFDSGCIVCPNDF